MTAMTLHDAIRTTGVDVYDYLDRQAEIPVVTQAACQGDVSILRVTKTAAATPIPVSGFTVAAGGTGGHKHTLHGAGFFDPARVSTIDLMVGRLTVPDGVDVIMSHPEHGMLLIAPGTYEIGTQREYAGEWRAVAD